MTAPPMPPGLSAAPPPLPPGPPMAGGAPPPMPPGIGMPPTAPPMVGGALSPVAVNKSQQKVADQSAYLAARRAAEASYAGVPAAGPAVPPPTALPPVSGALPTPLAPPPGLGAALPPAPAAPAPLPML